MCYVVERLNGYEVLGWHKMSDDLPPDQLLRIDWHDVIDKSEFSPKAPGSQASQLH